MPTSSTVSRLLQAVVINFTTLFATMAMAQGRSLGEEPDRVPVYQRHAFERRDHRRDRWDDRFRRRPQWVAPNVNSGWYQRPYPYHLDYYKMRYGGSYAPYFGNLYGTPQVVTVPPYYGPYGGVFGGLNGDGGLPPTGNSFPVEYGPATDSAAMGAGELPAP